MTRSYLMAHRPKSALRTVAECAAELAVLVLLLGAVLALTVMAWAAQP